MIGNWLEVTEQSQEFAVRVAKELFKLITTFSTVQVNYGGN
jgi:hypothetical protein